MTIQIDSENRQKIPNITNRDVSIMNTPAQEEEITLSSSEFDQFKDDNSPTTVTIELTQKIPIKEHMKLFRIYDNKFLNVNEKSSQGTQSYFFNLAMLDPTPVRKRRIKFTTLFAGLIFLALGFITFELKQMGLPLLMSPYVYTGIVAFVSIGLILIVYVIKEYRNTLVFYSQHGRIPIAEILFRVPSKAEFLEFVSELIKWIEAAKSKSHYSKTQTLAAELTEHRKLRDNGALTSKEYDNAKNSIMTFH